MPLSGCRLRRVPRSFVRRTHATESEGRCAALRISLLGAVLSTTIDPCPILSILSQSCPRFRPPAHSACVCSFEPSTGRPEHLLLTSVLVPPVPIRPSIVMDVGAGSNEDDLTIKLQEIIDVNNALKIALSKGAGMKMIMEDWNFLQVPGITSGRRIHPSAHEWPSHTCIYHGSRVVTGLGSWTQCSMHALHRAASLRIVALLGCDGCVS